MTDDSTTRCRLLNDAPAPGPWNMAVDEVLAEWAAENGRCAWRFYRWSEPTLSLGYFQEYHDRRDHESSVECAAVRRLSGGGAILHDAELTYGFVVPGGHRLAREPRMLYEAVHNTLIDVLGGWGLTAELSDPAPRPPDQTQPFLCFQRRSEGDVLVGDVKVAGSAQRRRHGAVLQHGSVLLVRSSSAPELASLEDVLGRSVPYDELIDAWLPRLQDRLDLTWERQPLGEDERRRAAGLVETLYGSDHWTEKRGRGT
ncbi:MAG: lipoate--protein ligase family protein [Planctomycetes bacterium]|nr:lipoate--protein ligase family protein [Planctomycetota bacterium]